MRVLKGYLVAVGMAGLCFTALFMIELLVSQPTSSPSFAGSVAQLLSTATYMLTLFCIVSAVTVLVPFCFIDGMARTLQLRSWFYFCASGMVIGAVYAVILAYIFSHVYGWYTDPPDYRPESFFGQLEGLLPTLAVSGFAGGYTYWRLAGRFIGRVQPEDATRLSLTSSR